MSQWGELVYYTENEIEDVPVKLDRLLALSGESRAWAVFRSTTEATRRSRAEIEKIQALLLEEDEAWISDPIEDDDEPDESWDRLPIEEVPVLYVPGKSLRVMIGTCPLADRVEAAVSESVPSEVRGEFCPDEMTIRIGWEELWERSEHHPQVLLCQPFVSVRFFSYCSPEDWQTTREIILGLSEVEAIGSELEAILGPLKRLIYWDV